MNPCSIHLFDKKFVQLQSLAAIKFLLPTPIYNKKDNKIAQKIVEDLEKTIDFPHNQNTLKSWKQEELQYISDQTIFTSWSKQMLGDFDPTFLISELSDPHSDLHQILNNPLDQHRRALRLLKALCR